MKFEIPPKLLTDAFKYASCTKSVSSKQLIPTIVIEVGEEVLYLGGMDPSGLVQSSIIVDGGKYTVSETTDEQMPIELARIMKTISGAKNDIVVSTDNASENININEKGNKKKLNESLPKIESKPQIPIELKDKVPYPKIRVADDESGEKTPITFRASVNFDSEIKMALPFSTESLNLTVSDALRVKMNDNISDFEDVLSSNVEWIDSDEGNVNITLNTDVFEAVMSLLTDNSVIYVHEQVVYVLTTLEWGYAGFVIPSWESM